MKELIKRYYAQFVNYVVLATAVNAHNDGTRNAILNLYLCYASVSYIIYSLSEHGVLVGFSTLEYLMHTIREFPLAQDLTKHICDPWFMDNVEEFAYSVYNNHENTELTYPMLSCLQKAIGMDLLRKTTHWFGVLRNDGELQTFALKGI